MSQPTKITSDLNDQREWPFDPSAYDRCPSLTPSERAMIKQVIQWWSMSNSQWDRKCVPALRRLLEPIDDVLNFIQVHQDYHRAAILRILIAEMHTRHNSYWAWNSNDWYQMEMVRAVALVWLFCGLRSNEIIRLRVGCIRWQHENKCSTETNSTASREAICWLDVPVNKTYRSFTKPVDRLVGEAIDLWERVRPPQPKALDSKTGAMVNFLFSYRGVRIGDQYLNCTLIPMLCRKAGVPESDARGEITSHRARSTIATQLYNAREPMSLFDLQEWLGHTHLESTQYYARVTPTKLAKKYAEAGYFERNVRTVEVLIDRDAILSGDSARGEPWQYYDLGHGWCTNAYFVECPHRMACPKCQFYIAKDSAKGHFLESQSNLQTMLQKIPLTEDERAAVEEGIDPFDKLCQKLIDVPTPVGPTPRELAVDGRRSLPVLPASVAINTSAGQPRQESNTSG